ncbi:hypothetical protein PSPO01_04819 [Paraphaeosphaeria sporulosa]
MASSATPSVASTQTPEAFLQTLTSTELAGYLNGSLRMQRHAGRWHILPSSPPGSPASPSPADMGTLNAIPHVTYIPRRSSFLADDISTYSRSTSLTSQTPQGLARCWNCNGVHYPKRRDVSYPIAPCYPVFERTWRSDHSGGVEQMGLLEQTQVILRWDTNKVDGLRMRGLAGKMTRKIEQFLSSVKETKASVETLVQRRLEVLRI